MQWGHFEGGQEERSAEMVEVALTGSGEGATPHFVPMLTVFFERDIFGVGQSGTLSLVPT